MTRLDDQETALVIAGLGVLRATLEDYTAHLADSLPTNESRSIVILASENLKKRLTLLSEKFDDEVRATGRTPVISVGV